MATNFAELKRAGKKDLKKLTDEVSKLGAGKSDKKSYEDLRFWRPQVDKAGNGYAVIRFLPSPAGEDMPWVQLWSHAFQGPMGKWYIENSLTTINQADPVSEHNSTLWNSGIDADKDTARKQKRKLSYIANVYIVKDPANPQNEGEVKLYKFGKKIFDKINDMMNTEFEDEAAVNPFDLWEGANFKLKIRKVEGYQNYDKSEFDGPAPLSEDDDDLERIWNSEFALTEFISSDNFKTYAELEQRLNMVLGLDAGDNAGNYPALEVSEEDMPKFNAQPKFDTPKQSAKPTVEESKDPWSDDDDDEGLTYFEKLAEG